MNSGSIEFSEKTTELKRMLDVVKDRNSDLTREGTCWVYAAFTDQLLLECWESGSETELMIRERQNKLLELRIFSFTAEYKVFRGNIGSRLRYRGKDQDVRLVEGRDYYDEWQYLDIDTTWGKELSKNQSLVKTTGGGVYRIPLPKAGWKDARLRVRNYFSDYTESGQAYVSDWRMVELIPGGKSNG